jgi:nucleotide-binding universal stress UspA family protein
MTPGAPGAMLRTILILVRGDGKGEGVLDHALALGRRFNAHLEVVHCRQRPQDMLPFAGNVPSPLRQQVLASATSLADEEERRVKAMFENYCRRAELVVVERPRDAPRDRPSASWSETVGTQADVVAIRGRLADVIAVAQPDHRLGIGFNTFEAALLETGRLVLLCPPLPVTDIGRHVAVAWSGTVEAASAVAAAMPILVAADRVTVLSALTGAAIDLGPEALGDHLASHGVAAEIGTFDARPTAVAQGLLAAARDAGADLLLMGAYGHSRRRELVMGGVTKYITDHADLPVLLQR